MAHSSNSNDIINEAKKTDLPTYTIRQISNLYKLPASTLRYYEDLGLLTDVVHTVFTISRILTVWAESCVLNELAFQLLKSANFISMKSIWKIMHTTSAR